MVALDTCTCFNEETLYCYMCQQCQQLCVNLILKKKNYRNEISLDINQGRI